MKFPALLIDTSTRYLAFARVEGDGVGKLIAKTVADNGEETIDQAVAELFPKSEEIAEIWLGEGPGSFVGLRSSFAYARMLAMLSGVPCRTFFSSRLWRSFFSVTENDWFLTRTNARLFYAERYTPAREAEAVDLGGAMRLAGEKFCFYDSWISTAQKNAAEEESLAAKLFHFADARIGEMSLRQEVLHLSEAKHHADLNPLYGHELNFALAKNT